ncbi:MAG: hypothetical protein AAB337_02385 [Patescibacteria group bacterium]
MKHFAWIALAGLLLGAGCTATSDETASVQLNETAEIPVAEGTEGTEESHMMEGMEMEMEVELEIGSITVE